MEALVFDIETGPEQDSVLTLMEPEFSAPSNYRDEAKIAEHIDRQRMEWREKAALDATTGRILAIGTMLDDKQRLLSVDPEHGISEQEVIRSFWEQAAPNGRWRHLVGFNSNRFDIPYLIRRSYKLGIRVPFGAMNGRYLNPKFIDLMDFWRLGDFHASISLDRLARHLGVGAKNGNGAEFAALLETDRASALDYLANDIRLTVAVAKRLGVIEDRASSSTPVEAEADY
jgi:predicted PolB exonuclease-like 3'-5' exonuclease